MKKAKKIILLSFDTLRADHLGCYGYKRKTSPNIDNLASESILFTNSFSPSSHTIPSHGSIFTGKYPSKHTIGFNQNLLIERGSLNLDIDTTLAELFRANGYSTAAFIGGIVLDKKTNFNAGFKDYFDNGPFDEVGRIDGYGTNEKVFSWLDKNYNEDFFIFIHYFDIHGPYFCSDEYSSKFIEDDTYKKLDRILKIDEPNYPHINKIPNYQKLIHTHEPSETYYQNIQHYISQYDSCILETDNIFNSLVNYLKKLNIYDETLIILTSDHGEAFGENNIFLWHGLTVTLDQVSVPFIIKPHKDWDITPKKIQEHVSTIDIFPTILDLSNIMYANIDIDGCSLCQLVEHQYDHTISERVLLTENERQIGYIYPNKSFIIHKKNTPSSEYYFNIPELIDELDGKRYYWDTKKEDTIQQPFDIYQKYRLVSDIINKFREEPNQTFTIFEIGAGNERNLEKFLPNDSISFLDKFESPVYNEVINEDIFTKNNEKKFDFIISIDVLEHIPQPQREKFIDISIIQSNIASIIAAPFEQKELRICEFLSNEIYRSPNETEYPWLKEHDEFGLPSLSKIIEIIQKYYPNYAIIPNGYLPRWLEMMSTCLLTENRSEFRKILFELWEFYNKSFYQYDNCEPAYRQVIIISKKQKIPDFLDLLSINPKNEDVINFNTLFQSFLEKIISIHNIQNISQITKKEEEFVHLEELINNKNNQINGITKHVKGLETRIFERDNQLKELSEVISERDNQLKELSEVISERENQLKELSEVISERENQLKGLSEVISERDNYQKELSEQIKGLESNISEKKAEIFDLQNIIAFNSMIMSSHDEEIIQLKNKFSYRLSTKIQALILEPTYKLLPSIQKHNTIIHISEFFDSTYYLDNNSDARLSGLSPSLHYLLFGWKDGKDPGPEFSTNSYFELYPDVKQSSINPLIHYELYGKQESRTIVAPQSLKVIQNSSYFNPNYYLENNPDIASLKTNPAIHYLLYGWKEGRDPGPDFSTVYYLIFNPDVFESGINPLVHYELFGKGELRLIDSPKPLITIKNSDYFNESYYLEKNQDIADREIDPAFHYLYFGWKEGRDPGPDFSTVYYLIFNPDVFESGINPLVHYELFGKRELRLIDSPKPLITIKNSDYFNESYYLEKNQDIANREIDPAFHYLYFGWKEGRDPGPDFSSTLFYSVYPEVTAKSMNPLLYYEQYIKPHPIFHIEEIEPLIFKYEENPEISIIIPAYNKSEYTYQCIQSILKNTPISFEIIVIDDNSSDNTPELIQKISNISYVKNDTNLGFIKSCNLGADIARGKYLLFLNNDTKVSDNWLSPLLIHIKKEDVGAVGSKLVYPDGRLQEAGGIIWNDGNGWNYGRGGDPKDPKYNYVRNVDYCSGAALLVKKDLFEQVGGFDILFLPAYYEDVDLCFSIRKLGYKILYEPESVVFHFEGTSCGKDLKTGVKQNQLINRNKFLKKWADLLAKKNLSPDQKNLSIARSKKNGQNILVIDQHVPFCDKDAGSYRMMNILKILSELGHNVTFIGLIFEQYPEYDTILQHEGIEVRYTPYLTSINEYIEENGKIYNLVILSRPHIVIHCIESVKEYCVNAQVIYDTVDLHFIRELRQAEINGDMNQIETADFSKNEFFKLAKLCDTIWVVSEFERKALMSEVSSLHVQVVPLIYDINKDVSTTFWKREHLLFIGNFLHQPNGDAVLWFIKDIFPIIIKKIPEIKIRIIGYNPPDELLSYKSENIEILGHVKDVSHYFATSRVCIAPLRFGAGVKGKICQSMSYGMPVVTTSIGAEGMNLDDGNNVLISDDAEKFAEKVINLYQNEELWSIISENSLTYIRDNMSSDVNKKRIQDAIRELSKK